MSETDMPEECECCMAVGVALRRFRRTDDAAPEYSVVSTMRAAWQPTSAWTTSAALHDGHCRRFTEMVDYHRVRERERTSRGRLVNAHRPAGPLPTALPMTDPDIA